MVGVPSSMVRISLSISSTRDTISMEERPSPESGIWSGSATTLIRQVAIFLPPSMDTSMIELCPTIRPVHNPFWSTDTTSGAILDHSTFAPVGTRFVTASSCTVS